ncbi:TPA: hypothetical protein PC496_000751 [Clostridioides difficile]|nr:hypothetical protein [Clostridioides difficile]
MVIFVFILILGVAIIGVLDMLYDISGRDEAAVKKVVSDIGVEILLWSIYILISVSVLVIYLLS